MCAQVDVCVCARVREHVHACVCVECVHPGSLCTSHHPTCIMPRRSAPSAPSRPSGTSVLNVQYTAKRGTPSCSSECQQPQATPTLQGGATEAAHNDPSPAYKHVSWEAVLVKA